MAENQTYQVQQGQTASGIAQQAGLTPSQFLELNPSFAAQGNQGDYQGLSGLIQPGQEYTLGDNQLIVTGSQANNEAKQYGADLNQLLNQYGAPPEQGGQDINMATYSDPMTQLLDRQMQVSDMATKQLISRIQAKRQQSANDTQAQADMYKRGLQLLGVQGTGAQATPDLLQGQIFQVQQQTERRLSELDQEESFAILEARQAQEDNNIQLLKEKMNYIKEVKREKQDALKRMYEQMNYQTQISDMKAAEIYDTLNTLNEEEKEQFLQGIAQRFGIPLGTLVTAVARHKDALDRQAIEDYRETARFNKSMRSGSGSGGSGDFSAQEKRKLEQNFGEDWRDTPRQELLDYLYGKEGRPEEMVVQFSNSQKSNLAELGYSGSEIASIESDINQYGIDVALEGMTRRQRNKIRDILG